MKPRLQSLLNRWIDGELAAPEDQALQRLLVEDPEARQVCYDLLMVDRLLDEHVGGSPEKIPLTATTASEAACGRKRPWFHAVPLAAAAAIILCLFSVYLFTRGNKPSPAPSHSAQQITGSKDSRITIAQRQDARQWHNGELLRLERGTAEIRLNQTASVNLDGPAAIELLDSSGNVRLLEGMASFDSGTGRHGFVLHVPGGTLRGMEARYITEVLANGITNIRVESGLLEIRPRDAAQPIYPKGGDALRLDPNGSTQPIRLPNYHFRSGLPQQLGLFHDLFDSPDGTKLTEHKPRTGQSWTILSELNPTIIRNQRLDTSSGARRVVANLAKHEPRGQRAVYIFSFDLLPPAWIHDKDKRQGGVEYITLLDHSGHNIVSISARASNSHRWQLIDEESKAATALTPVCALWTHSLTLCYGLDGLATLHDGPTAQAPIIAELRIANPPPVSGILLGNWDGGDLAVSRIEAALLPGVPSAPQ